MVARAGLVVIGIDAASGPLVREWASQGVLPNFAALMRRGRSATLRGVDGFFTGSTWPSLLTATNPARHGIHYLVQLVSGSYRFARPHESEYIRAPMFWQALCDAGKRVAILDLPLTRLDPGIRGIQTVEWAGHDSIFGFQAHPPELAADILGKHGRHPVPPDCDANRRTPDDYRAFVDSLVRGVEAKARLTADLLARERCDLFMQVFTETHCAGHQCWHLHDPTHPSHDPDFVAAHGDPIRRVYQALDAALGQLIEAAGESPVMVVMPHGMSHALGVHQLLPKILERLGLSVALPPVARRLGPMDIVRAIERRLPAGARALAHRIFERAPRPGSFGLPSVNVDTRSSRCFVVPNGLAVSGIRLNLAGREPHGTVRPGAEEQALFAQLREDLLAIRNEATNAPLVLRVARTADLYQGPNLDCLPDILVQWDDSVASGSAALDRTTGSTLRVSSERIGTVEAVNGYGRTGEHRVDGMLIAAGPGIEAGAADLSMSLLDVAPTIAAALGVAMPGVEGRVIAAMNPVAGAARHESAGS